MIQELRLPSFDAKFRRVAKVLVKVGDEVRLDTHVIELSTDKSYTTICSTLKGVVSKVVVQRDQIIEIGDVLFEIEENNRLPDLADVSLCPQCRGVPEARGVVHGHGIRPAADVWIFLAICRTCDMRLRRSSMRDAYEVVGRTGGDDG